MGTISQHTSKVDVVVEYSWISTGDVGRQGPTASEVSGDLFTVEDTTLL